MIRSYCGIPDNDSARFDATPWFEKASAEDIVEMACQEWTGKPLEDMTVFVSSLPGYSALASIVAYRDARAADSQEATRALEIRIDPLDAMKWLEAKRHDVHDAIVARIDEVTFTPDPPASWQNASDTDADYLRRPDAVSSDL